VPVGAGGLEPGCADGYVEVGSAVVFAGTAAGPLVRDGSLDGFGGVIPLALAAVVLRGLEVYTGMPDILSVDRETLGP